MTSPPESSPRSSALGSSSLKHPPTLTTTFSSINDMKQESKQPAQGVGFFWDRGPFQSPRGKSNQIADLRQITQKQRHKIQNLEDALSVACGKIAARDHELRLLKMIKNIQDEMATAHTQAYTDITREAEREAHIVAMLMDHYELTQTDIDKLRAKGWKKGTLKLG